MAITVFYLTRHEVKTYDSKMTIYTGISARSVGVDENVKLDFFTANNAMDNLIAIFKARNTVEEASLRLLSHHLSLPKSDSSIISWQNFKDLNEFITPALLRQVRVLNNPDATYENVKAYMGLHGNSVFNTLLTSSKHYGIDGILDKINAQRRASSDMIDISFESDDPGICAGTLAELAGAYFTRYREMKRTQNASAVEYFEKQLKDAFAKLQDSENRLKAFITENKILNFYEQGKSLAIYEKEEEQEEQEVRQAAAGADVTLKKLEEKMAKNRSRSQTVDSLANLRDEVNNIRFRMQAMLLDRNKFGDEIAGSREKMRNLYNQISGKVAALYQEDFSVEGIPSSQILSEWLRLYMEKEKQLTYLEQVTASKNMVSARMTEFAPLGAGLKRLEREVSINESQYITILHGLNMANLQRQSIEQASSQNLVDEPFLPSSARKSKRLLLVIGSGIVGLIMVLAAIIIRILFDGTLQNAGTAGEKTGLRVWAAFPGWHHKSNNDGMISTIDLVATQLVNEILVSAALLATQGRPHRLCIYQSVSADGGSNLAEVIHKKLQSLQFASHLFSDGGKRNPNEQTLFQHPDEAAKLGWDNPRIKPAADSNDFLLVALPPLKNLALPVGLFAGADIILVSVNAGRQWKLFDQQLLKMVENISGKVPGLVLNNVNTDNIKDFFGQIPLRTFLGRIRTQYK
jgi:uncharacterized protein involved in exopolysaccharide biosynthesis